LTSAEIGVKSQPHLQSPKYIGLPCLYAFNISICSPPPLLLFLKFSKQVTNKIRALKFYLSISLLSTSQCVFKSCSSLEFCKHCDILRQLLSGQLASCRLRYCRDRGPLRVRTRKEKQHHRILNISEHAPRFYACI
jgi:hypothetical protein